MEMSIRKEWILAAVLLGMGSGQVCANPAEPSDIGREVHSSNIVLVNARDFASEEPNAVGLYILGDKVRITQRGNILLTGDGAIGIRLDGTESKVTLRSGTQIISEGLQGTGILIYGGGDHNLILEGDLQAAGKAIELWQGVQVNSISLSGVTSGGEYAIYIGENSSVEVIDLDKGASLSGDIISNGSDATNLNFNTGMSYGGNISGAINLHVNEGTLNFGGAVDVVRVEVREGTQLFGNSIKVSDGFINHGTIGAGSADTNLIINGNLTSNGTLKRISGGKAGWIIVKGTANVEGSTVTTDSLLPNETATVLIADSITGKLKNTADNPVPISALLNATGKIVGNTIVVTTHDAQNTTGLNSQEATTLNAMKNMYDKLDDAKQEEMRDLYNLDVPEVKQTLTQISSNDSAQIMSVAQQNTAVDKMIGDRIARVFMPDYIDLRVNPRKFADGDDNAPDMTVKVEVPKQENNFWLNYMKNWGSLRGGTDYHGSAIVGGYDRPFGKKWRAGVFATYGTIGYGAESSRATVYDTRLGLYAGYHNRESDVYLYVNGGQLRNSLHRGISSLGLSTNANYKSRIVEIGGEYKYDLQPNKQWHVSPYVNFQASHLRQNSYSESGAGIYNQHVDADSNTYLAAQAGLDLKRYYRTGVFGLRFGVKHGFAGADPDLRISYEGDGANSYRLRQKRDKTHFVFSLRGEDEIARGWFLGGEAELQLGENDKDVTASVMFRRVW
ncbi:MAG: autotransporter domain-containing protein [Selenomonadaceae bacterium]|nr:autotransporter domain-containing protein [Selenomonadaceae bacterium]